MAERKMLLRAHDILPSDVDRAILIGRVWRPDRAGPAVVTLRGQEVVDITTAHAPTVSALFELDDPLAWVHDVEGEELGSVDEIYVNGVGVTPHDQRLHFLAPIDLQAIKGCWSDLYCKPHGKGD